MNTLEINRLGKPELDGVVCDQNFLKVDLHTNEISRVTGKVRQEWKFLDRYLFGWVEFLSCGSKQIYPLQTQPGRFKQSLK